MEKQCSEDERIKNEPQSLFSLIYWKTIRLNLDSQCLKNERNK